MSKRKTKNKKKKKSKSDKEDTLTKILILIIFIIVVFYVPDLWQTFDVTTKIRRAWWERKAGENLEAKLDVIGGEEYFFVQGSLRSTCERIENKNHCPLQITEGEPPLYFDEPPRFYEFSIPMRTSILNGSTEKIVFKPEEPEFMSFVEKNKDTALSVEIQDYILKTGICKRPILNNTLCAIRWDKTFEITDASKKRDDIFFNLTKFELKLTNASLDIEFQGQVSGKVINPVLEMKIYIYSNHSRNLQEKYFINLTPENSHFAFNTEILVPKAKLMISNETSFDTGEEVIFGEKTTQRYSFLLLFTDKDYFYAKEKIVINNTIVENTYE